MGGGGRPRAVELDVAIIVLVHSFTRAHYQQRVDLLRVSVFRQRVLASSYASQR